MAAPIKTLPATTTEREFSGSQPEYPSRKFIGLCEGVIKNSCVIEQGDKIAFIKSRLLPGSRAFSLMQASMFCNPQENNYY